MMNKFVLSLSLLILMGAGCTEATLVGPEEVNEADQDQAEWVNVDLTNPEIQAAIKATNQARQEFGLGEAHYAIYDPIDSRSESMWLVDLAAHKQTLITSDDPLYADGGTGRSILLEPSTAPNTLFTIMVHKGSKGPIARIHKDTGVSEQLFQGTASDLVIAPAEDLLLSPNAGVPPDPNCHPAVANPGCEVEATSLTLNDLLNGTERTIGKLPEGYSYAASNFAPNQMAEGLDVNANIEWKADGIHAWIYSTEKPVGNREPLKQITLTPDQETVTL